jgi:hypothetical protein
MNNSFKISTLNSSRINLKSLECFNEILNSNRSEPAKSSGGVKDTGGVNGEFFF